MIPRWLLFFGLVLGIWFVWSRRRAQQLQLENPNANWNKGFPSTGGVMLPPITSDWRNQPSASAGRAEESFVPYLAAGWLDSISAAITNGLRKNAPAAGNNDNDDTTYNDANGISHYGII